MKYSLALARFAVCALVLSAAVTLHAQFIITFDGPNPASSTFTGINAWGEVSGSYQDPSGTHGFIRELDGRFITFDVPGSTGTMPSAIGLFGEVIGSTDGPTFTDGDFTEATRGFIRHRSGAIDVFNGCPDIVSSTGPTDASASPQAINDKGSIIGNCQETAGIDFFKSVAFFQNRAGTSVTVGLLDPNGYTTPSALNDKNQVAGWYRESGLEPEHGFITQPGGVNLTSFDVFPGVFTSNYGTRPTALNAQGDTAGVYTTNSDEPDVTPTYQAFLRTSSGTISTFEVPGSLETYPLSISNGDMIVGYYTDAAGTHGFVRRVDGTIETFNVPISNAQSISFIAISPSELILGSYTDQSGNVHGFIYVPLWFLLER